MLKKAESNKAGKLTAGELSALLKFVHMNGIHGTQWTPYGARRDTIRNLVKKGYLTGSWDAPSVERHGSPRIVGSD